MTSPGTLATPHCFPTVVTAEAKGLEWVTPCSVPTLIPGGSDVFDFPISIHRYAREIIRRRGPYYFTTTWDAFSSAHFFDDFQLVLQMRASPTNKPEQHCSVSLSDIHCTSHSAGLYTYDYLINGPGLLPTQPSGPRLHALNMTQCAD